MIRVYRAYGTLDLRLLVERMQGDIAKAAGIPRPPAPTHRRASVRCRPSPSAPDTSPSLNRAVGHLAGGEPNSSALAWVVNPALPIVLPFLAAFLLGPVTRVSAASWGDSWAP